MKGIIFLFDGQGAFRPGIGNDIYERYPRAKAVIDHSSEVLGYDLTGYLWGDRAAETSSKTSVAQPAISTVSLAYADVLRDIGVEGTVSLGHSLGEATAAIYCGIASFDDGIRMIKKRGEVMEAAGGKGAMMAVLNIEQPALEEMCRKVTAEISEPVVVANINAPNQIVISGSHEAIKRVAQSVAENQGRAIALNVGGAWHSPHLKSAAENFAGFLDGIAFKEPKRWFYSVVEQKILDDPAVIKQSLKDQMLAQVNWVQAVRNLRAIGYLSFLEIGPSKILKDLVTRIDSGAAVDSVALHGELEKIKLLGSNLNI
ncbi:ACP S-malonyltransferase [candidate division WOR-3 bacterium]|nr:ACP S-malonyltransferase [candidate division WOR-3 bacterium]